MPRLYLFLVLLCTLIGQPNRLIAQARFPTPSFSVSATKTNFIIDGALDEGEWAQHRVVDQLRQYFPTDTLAAQFPTEIFMTYDQDFLYLAAKCHTSGKSFIIPSYRRDFRAGGNDNISFIFDTFQDKTNAFLFGINPYGVMREALISNGGSDNQFFNTYWDNTWEGESKIYADSWTCELKIPFRTLRYLDGGKAWNFASYRFDTQSNEQSTFVRIPQNQLIYNLAFSGPMKFAEPLTKKGPNLALIPYIRAGQARDYLKEPVQKSHLNAIGADFKVGITPSLILDATINPDFSTVEADKQIQNLTRFDISLSFPEQRQFFLENSDLFGTFGSQEIFSSTMGNQNFTPFIPVGSVWNSIPSRVRIRPYVSSRVCGSMAR